MGNYVAIIDGTLTLVRDDPLTRKIFNELTSGPDPVDLSPEILGKKIERRLLKSLDMDSILSIKGDGIVLDLGMPPIPVVTKAFIAGCKECGINPNTGQIPSGINSHEALSVVREKIRQWTATDISRA